MIGALFCFTTFSSLPRRSYTASTRVKVNQYCIDFFIYTLHRLAFFGSYCYFEKLTTTWPVTFLIEQSLFL